MLLVTLLERLLVHLARFLQGLGGTQPIAVRGQQLADRFLAIGRFQVLHVELALAIGQLPFHRRARPDEAQVDGVEVEQVAGRDALEQQLVPDLRPGETLVVAPPVLR